VLAVVKKTRILVCFLGFLLLATTSAPAIDAQARPLEDGPNGPARVAVLVPFMVEALSRLPPSRVQVVAAVRRSPDVSVDAGGVADLGSPHGPSLEILAASRPDLVVADRAMHAALAPRLEQIATLVLVDSTSVATTFESLLRIGEAVGARDEMDVQVRRARRELHALRAKRPIATLAFLATPGTFFTMTNRTWLGDLLRELNFENLGGGQRGQERFPGFVVVSDEVLATMRPELVLIVAHGDPAAIRAELDSRVRTGGPWTSLRRSARVRVLDADHFGTNPGLGLPDLARRLRTLVEGGSP